MTINQPQALLFRLRTSLILPRMNIFILGRNKARDKIRSKMVLVMVIALTSLQRKKTISHMIRKEHLQWATKYRH
jgi:hypothetical protein